MVVEELWQVLAEVVEGEWRIGGPPAKEAQRDLLDPRLAEKRNGVRARKDAMRREQADDGAGRGSADRVDRGIDVLLEPQDAARR